MFRVAALSLILAAAVSGQCISNPFMNPMPPAWRGLPGTTYAGWDVFVNPIGAPNFPDDPDSTAFATLTQSAFGLLTSSCNIYSPSVSLHESAKFNGSIDMSNKEQAARKRPERPAEKAEAKQGSGKPANDADGASEKPKADGKSNADAA